MKIALSSLALAQLLLLGSTAAQQPTGPADEKQKKAEAICPAHGDRSKMNERGEQGMGFSQTANTHHFLLKPNGGLIQVESNDAKDIASRDIIRGHLTHIAHAFSNGDFDIPMFIHNTVPPGVPEMKLQKAKINYAFEELPNGGRVVITTSDPESLAAIHKFLRFQIEEHQTKDPTTVQ